MDTRDMVKLISVVILVAVVVGEAYLISGLRMDVSALARENYTLQLQLYYYQSTFKERVGFAEGKYGARVLVRALSIDGGKNWIEISRTREVLQPPYLHQRYPELEPDSLKELVTWEEVVR